MEKEQKKTLYRIGLPIILGTILLIGVSYAWLTLTLNGTKTNVLKAGTLSLTLTDDATEGINLESTVPMLDEVGVTTSPYSFTLTNNGDIDSGYTIYLDDVALDTSETRLADTVIKYNLVKDGTSMATALLSTTGTNPNRVLDSGTIKPGETYRYDLRLWIDQDATTAISGQVFKGKIRIEASQTTGKPTPESCFTFNDGNITDYKCVSGNLEALPVITDVVIPSKIGGVTVTSIDDDAFRANQLTSVIIPNSVTTIGVYAFSGNQLTSLTIPNSVTELYNYAFYENKLTSVIISNNLTNIYENVFSNNKLTSVIIPNGVSSIGAFAFDGNQLTSVTIPNSVTFIGDYAFSNNKLTSALIPDSVEVINEHAFSYNQLTSVTIPNSVTFISYGAFSNNQLTSVIIKGKSSSADFSFYEPSWGWASGYSDDNIIWNG